MASATRQRTKEPSSGVRDDGTVFGAADILCDGSGRVGALSYIVPDGLMVRPGDAVHVPFGAREVHGMVLGPGDPTKATRAIESVFGTRATEADLAAAADIARLHFCDIQQVAVRLSPRTGRGAEPFEAGEVALVDDDSSPQLPDRPEITRRFLLRAPLVNPARLAALEAARLVAASDGGQVLVVCPTVELVAEVHAQFSSGAARVDKRAVEGAWSGFGEGTVPVAVGTRSAALFSAKRLAGIVVVEEEHPGHLEAVQPHTHARDVAAMRSLALDVPLTLIGANPSAAALGGGVRVLPVGSRADWPKVRVIDRGHFPPEQQQVPPPLTAAINRANDAGIVPLVLAERRRWTRRCVRCNTPKPCVECDTPVCRHFGPECEKCGDQRSRIVGWDHERLLAVFGNKVKPVTLVEMSEARDAGVVVIFDIDAALNAPGLAPEAIAAHLLLAGARAAGRDGTLVVATRDSTQQLVADLCGRRDQMAVAKRTWATAKDEQLPPFGRLVSIQVASEKAPTTSGWPGRVFGPRKVGSDWEILVRIPDERLGQLGSAITRLRRRGKVRLTVT